jgi:hypothetical protein
LANNESLESLSCATNSLVALNVKNGNNINFVSFNSLENPDLNCIQVDDPEWSTANWTNIDDHTIFSDDCNYYTWVPDDSFEQVLIEMGCDDYPDDYVLTAMIDTVKTLELSSKGIFNLTGIEDFTLLKYLYCDDNNLNNLDISNNLALIVLHCQKNNLNDIDVSTNLNLIYLVCWENNLSNLDVSNNAMLKYLSLAENNISSLDVSNNNDLEYLYFDLNNIGMLDISNNPYLIHLTCQGNNLNNLDISNNMALEFLDFRENNVSSINVSNNILLQHLICGSNNISHIDVSNNPALQGISAVSNNLSSLDITNNTLLEYLQIDANQLVSLNMKNGNNTIITTFSALANPDLLCIQVDDADYSTENWPMIDLQSFYSEDCGYVGIDFTEPDNSLPGNLLNNRIRIYPNPASQQINIELKNTNDQYFTIESISIADLNGKMILGEKISLIPGSETYIDISHFVPGLYLIRIQFNDACLYYKFLVN